MKALRYVDAWLDHDRLGCGRARVFVITEGWKWITVLDPVTLTKAKLPLRPTKAAPGPGQSWSRACAEPIEKPDLRRLRRIMRRRRAVLARHDKHFPARETDQVLDAIKQELTR